MTKTFANMADLMNQQNPVQVLISLVWLSRTELKGFLKHNGLPVTHNFDRNLATARIAFRGFVLLSSDSWAIEKIQQGWIFEKDFQVYNGEVDSYSL